MQIVGVQKGELGAMYSDLLAAFGDGKLEDLLKTKMQEIKGLTPQNEAMLRAEAIKKLYGEQFEKKKGGVWLLKGMDDY